MPKRKAKATVPKGRGRPPKKASNQTKVTEQPSKKRKLEPFNFEPDEVDPIIHNLKKFDWDKGINFDFGLEILDQIALEGLHGITFKRLLHMLDAISPKFNCIKDNNAQEYVWTVLVKLMTQPQGSGVKAYFSPLTQMNSGSNKTPSSSQETKSPNKSLFLDKEIKLPKDTVARLSKRECSLFAVQDGIIMGSCQNYLKRQNVTNDLLQISARTDIFLEALHALNDQFGLTNVFFVADQEVRRKAILPDWSDPNVDIKMREFACLELIGRTRSLGVVFPNDKALGRYRILLTGKKFISQYQQSCTSHIVHHIIRFSKYIIETPDDGKVYKGQQKSSKLNKFIDFEVDDIVEDDQDIQAVKSICCNPRRLKADSDMLKMVYQIIAHSKGLSPLDIRRKLRLPRFHVRNHLKNLASIELIGSHMKRIDDQTFRIYRARHRSLVYKRRLREKLQRSKTKINGKIKFDDTDLKAKSILGLRRSQFSQAEDSLLIICRICCLLIEPNLTKKVSFCVHKRFIRNLLHDEFCESHDKTADACLRRIKYLRKLPNNVMSINELTAELREDPDINRFIQLKESVKTEEKLNKLFTQLLKVVRAKLPHLLGLSSNGASGHLLARRQTIIIESYADLKEHYELIDCQATNSSRCRPNPGTTVLQLAQPLNQHYKLDLSECNDMNSIAILSSACTYNAFKIELKLKVPPVIVGLDQGNENYKQLCAKAKETTKELLSNLSCSNPSSDSRRALFMLRNELKSQALDKFGNLADALIVQPCNVRFSSDKIFEFDQMQLSLQDFLLRSNFCLPIRESAKPIVPDSDYDKKPTEMNVEINETVEAESSKKTRPTRSSTRVSKSPRKKRMVDETKNKLTDKATDQTSDENKEQTNEVPNLVNLKPMIKAIERVLSWAFVMPGIEFDNLFTKVKHLTQTRENLIELLNLMVQLELISEYRVENSGAKLTHKGIVRIPTLEARCTLTYEPQSNAYIKFGQMLSLFEQIPGSEQSLMDSDTHSRIHT